MIARNPARLATVYSLPVSDVLGPYSGCLGNGSDTVRVRDASGNAIDSVTYDSRFPWAQSTDALGTSDRFTGLTSSSYQYKGRSLQRVNVTWPSGDPANWLASPLTGPTPTAAQSVPVGTPISRIRGGNIGPTPELHRSATSSAPSLREEGRSGRSGTRQRLSAPKLDPHAPHRMLPEL